ncbi:apolipoprotein L1 isoform X2 [Trichomycterus rosablanca]
MNQPTVHQNQEHTDGIKKERDEEKMKSREDQDTTTAELQRIMKSKNPGRVHVPLKTDEQEAAAGSNCTEDESDEFSVNKNQTDEADEEKMPKKTKMKKKNPFMPHVVKKGHVVQKKRGEIEPVEKKSLVEQLNELRLDRAHRDEHEDLESLMEWWSTVKQWEPTTKDEDMTEKEEAKAFAVTAERVQRGMRVFNQLYSERAEALWQHVIDLYAIADALDRFSWRTKVAQITGGSTSAVGGVATIAGLALAPVTMGTSLIVTAVGLGVATAGGLTSASAGISSAVNDSLDRKKVERIVQDFQTKMADIDKCTRFIKRGVENLRQLNAPRVTKMKVSDNDFPKLTSVYEDGAMAGKAVLTNAREIARVTQVAMATGGTAARAAQVASMATGVLSGLFVAMDVYFVAKDSRELRKGAKSEFAKKIREVTEQLQQGLVELNGIRDELQLSGISTSTNSSINTISNISTTSNTSTDTISNPNFTSNTSNITSTPSHTTTNISNTDTSTNTSNTSTTISTNTSTVTSSSCTFTSADVSSTPAVPADTSSSSGTKGVPAGMVPVTQS